MFHRENKHSETKKQSINKTDWETEWCVHLSLSTVLFEDQRDVYQQRTEFKLYMRSFIRDASK